MLFMGLTKISGIVRPQNYHWLVQDYRANECTAWIFFFPLELVFQLEHGFSNLVVQHWNHLDN